SDTVGIRVAGRYSEMKGYIRVVSPPVAGTTPMDIKRFPKQDEVFFRSTLAWNPSDRVSVKLKATITDTKMIGGSSNFSDIVACPYGVPQRPSETASNCLNDGRILLTQIPAAAMALNPLLTNPNGSRANAQELITGTIEWQASDALTLTSVSGYYGIREKLTSNGGYGPISNNTFAVRFNNKQYSQELRLASDDDGPLNFLVGGFYEDRKLYTLTAIVVPQFLLRLPNESTNQRQKSTSAFGQILFDPTDQVQVTLGGRYTHEVKDLKDYTVTPVVGGVYGTPVDVTQNPLYGSTKLKFNNFSPEATVTWKPQDDLMVFASYKRGYKSGGFDAGYTNAGILANPARSQRFNPEKVEGVEGGIKSQFAGRQITMNLTGYWYDYKGLQVSVFDTIARAFRLQNAAKARVRGLELETRFRPDAVPGLNLHATLAYNDAKFREYLADCYQGQTKALGCNALFNPAPNQLTPPAGSDLVNGVFGTYTAQDLSGRRLRKAPKFAATFGGYYETAVTSGLMLSLSTDVSYSGSYVHGTNYQPLAGQDSFAKIDATLRLFREDKRWELAAIGRNLTNKRNLINGIDRTGTGSGKGTILPSCTGVGQTGCAAASDIIGTPTLPRTVALQLTWRY
ncbi:MAG TPA: TonB-dependent receptor, partial [Novosphingobium sp.]|nr:TonB-dependent receptor [Novosphingobium sp.]